jgi:hypothetical protein
MTGKVENLVGTPSLEGGVMSWYTLFSLVPPMPLRSCDTFPQWVNHFQCQDQLVGLCGRGYATVWQVHIVVWQTAVHCCAVVWQSP